MDRVAVGRWFPPSRPTSVFAANVQSRCAVQSDNCVLNFNIDQRFGLAGLRRRKLEVMQICRERIASNLVIFRLWDLVEALVGCIWLINSEGLTPVIIYPYTEHHPKPV